MKTIAFRLFALILLSIHAAPLLNAHTYASPVLYQACLITTNDCGSDTSCVAIETTLLSHEISTSASIDVSPNPVHDRANIYIQGVSASNLNLRLSNALGQVFIEQTHNLHNGGLKTSLNLEPLTSEIHLLEVEGGGIRLTEKIIYVKWASKMARS